MNAGDRARPNAEQVRMGELRTGSAGDSFRTLLGSCIGLAIWDPQAKVGGLAHVMLPSSSGHDGPPGKFADTAIHELIRQLESLSGHRERLVAKIVGGARMFDSPTESTIGDQNIDAVCRGLDDEGIPVLGSDCGGTSGRRMVFSVATGHVVVEAVGSEAKQI